MPAAQLVVQNQVDQFRAQSDEKMTALRACLERIDRSVVQCLAGLDEYQTCYADLDTLNKNLTGLGASAEPLPAKISVEQLERDDQCSVTVATVNITPLVVSTARTVFKICTITRPVNVNGCQHPPLSHLILRHLTLTLLAES